MDIITTLFHFNYWAFREKLELVGSLASVRVFSMREYTHGWFPAILKEVSEEWEYGIFF
jgi:hypothetical protein